MLRINQQRSATGAKSYFEEGLAREDYYTQDAIVGRWGGRGAERLGLIGEVQREAFLKLCDNQNPLSGHPLTPRSKTERTVGYDFNWHAPKSVSLLYTLTKDERILAAFRDAVQLTMRELESDVRTRVRQGGQNSERITGNLTYAEFIHLTARPVNGVPDPHLHAHCFVFNATHDDIEGRWKAAQFREVVRDAPYFEAAFHARLSKGMADLGLTIDRTKAGWEVAGISKTVLDKFSRRTAKIEELAREKGITDAAEKSQLGAKTREKKGEPKSLDALRAEWKGRLTEAERGEVKSVLTRRQTPKEPQVSVHGAIDHALRHGFERSSVVEDRTLLAAALKRGYGSILPEDARRDFDGRIDIIHRRYSDRNVSTTKEVLAEESAALEFARAGRGTCRPFRANGATYQPTGLNLGQAEAVRHVLTSADRVMLIRGAAGTGKTTLLKAADAAIRSHGSAVHVFAPTSEASRGVLRKEGFQNADTVAKLLADRATQEKVKGQVLWMDEAGLLGTKDLQGVFRVAREQGARVVLVGDSRQHKSVARGDGFRLLETQAGLQAAEVRDIRRQQGEYKRAIEALAEGNLETGFTRLDRMGAIREIAGEERHQALAADYLSAMKDKKTALVVAPTHAEAREVTHLIREEMKTAGFLKGREQVFTQLVSYGLTEAERADRLNYQPGDVVRFHQNVRGGFRSGQAVTVMGRDAEGNILVAREQGTAAALPLDQAKHFDVYQPRELALAVGDRLRVTRNGMTADGKGRLHNGNIATVAAINRRGDIVLDSGQVIAKDFGHVAHGFCTTSHASQGKTVDRVLVAIGQESFPATSQEQFYVSASRGREAVTIFCEDKRELLEAVSRAGTRISATELTAPAATAPTQQPARRVRLGEHIHRQQRAEKVRQKARTDDRSREPVIVPERRKERGRDR
ncbi:MobF family relaxase [Fimbriiglobus ruber]|uniref:Conjugal transfer protein n=1 Tax=Fimbriiglobus ruber TaxID=1908690 RepID=A0A225E3Y5_9BACT|nr:MobF family relaxase [Fimbriiglobus ruber]OWK46464.1 conjugal transfer protein [Fimbriiglobus ruber]